MPEMAEPQNRFRRFVDSLDTTAGHILVLLLLLVYFTCTVFFFEASWTQRLIDMVVGALLKGMDGRLARP
jgi:hypothetical protein